MKALITLYPGIVSHVNRGSVWSSINTFGSTRALLPSQTRLRQRVARVRCFQSAVSRMARSTHNAPSFSTMLNQTTFEDVRDLWFSHLSDDEFFVPGKESLMRWYKRDDEFDKECRARVGNVLQAVQDKQASAEEILSAAKPSAALDYLSLVLLFDQIPRNLYRGEASVTVFNFFDPIAQHIATKAIELKIPTEDPAVRYKMAYRSWFYLPYMHSEDLKLHKKAVDGYAKARQDFLRLLDGSHTSSPSEQPGTQEAESACLAALTGREEDVKEYLTTQVDFEKRHQNIIQKFGRYPHRNRSLGREPTEEETQFLENGGDTFGG